ncbi:MAG: Asp-tRNA(Asn)/Glu-tRNA(Gln) amidotransferase subunit GatC [Acidobacteria bacterium]|nr:Asp-tRNA(Asn)/Glu-tRNA(Gln) amidotransferase subunit GatC [Acidobacteriota bacterium]MBA3887518.1 Asp-tRNA(Asn)/Glu-tRNA(Gln) amidotransferase subunit GatC [Acidobacteriota bacterium]
MPDSLPRAEVERVARLARLALTDDEANLFARQLADILGYVEQVQAIDTTGIAPTSHPHITGTVQRADVVEASLDRDTALASAPAADHAAGFFKVPRVLGS